MSEIQTIDTGTEVLPISGQDIKYWDIVQRVRKQFSEDCVTTRAALKRANVGKSQYYDALKCPYVQTMMVAELEARRQATHQVMEQAWLEVLMNMVSIAKQDSPARDAVAAAKFLHEISKEVEVITKDEQSQAKDFAAELTASFLGKGRVTLRKTVREIELSQ